MIYVKLKGFTTGKGQAPAMHGCLPTTEHLFGHSVLPFQLFMMIPGS